MARFPAPCAVALALLLCGAAGAAAQGLPPAVAAQQHAWFTECRFQGGRPEAGAEFVTREDLNGDGRPDWILDANAMLCQGAYMALCPGQACPLAVFLSGPGGWRRAYLETVHGWELDRSAAPPVLVVTWLPGHCGRRPRTPDGCAARYAIDGQGVTEVGARPPAPAAKPARPAPAPAAAWQLRPVQGRGDAAMAEGPGVIAGIALVCNGAAPIAVVTLRARPPAGQAVMSFAFPSGRIDAPLSPLPGAAPDVWYADLRASRLPRLLAGNDAGVPVLINGGGQGRLSLAGSRAAIRSALAPCYPF